MTHVALVAAALLALATPAEACHRYSRWAYGWPQTCPSHKAAGAAERHGYERREVMRIARASRETRHSRTIDTRADQRVRPDPPDAPSKDDLARLRAAMEMDR